MNRRFLTISIVMAAGFLAAFFLVRIPLRGRFPSPLPSAEAPSPYRACIRSEIHFVPHPRTGSVRIRMLAIPPRLDHQTLLSRRADPLPTDSGTERGSTWLEWTFNQPSQQQSVVLVQCAQRQRHGQSDFPPTDTSLEPPSDFLVSDSLHPLDDSLLRNLAATIPPGEPLGRTRWIWDTVKSRLRYGGYDPIDRGAAVALGSGRGDCSEFSDLQVALMRLLGIPARTPRGWTRSGDKTESHQWAEGFFPQRGWLEFDPLWAASGHHPFETMSGLRLELAHQPSGRAMDGQARASWRWSGEAPVFTWRDSLWPID